MKFQDELLTKMEADLGDGYDLVGGGEDEEDDAPAMRERCQSEVVKDKVQFMEQLSHK